MTPSNTAALAAAAARFAVRADGGEVAYEDSGPRDGHPVFFLHGTPGSRVGVLPRPFELSRRRVRLISIDRPGYGESDRRPGRDVASVAEDVAAVADKLGIETFSVSGRSGGGPHALACGALLPDRVRSVVALVSIAPFDADGLDWYAGMTASNVRAYRMARAVAENPALTPDLAMSLAVDHGALATDFIAERLLPELPPPDLRIVADARIRGLLLAGFRSAANTKNMREAHKGGDAPRYLVGQLDDHLAFVRPWGFDPADIRCPVYLWHGGWDVYSPPSHSAWLASRIPQAVLTINSLEAHFGAVKYYPHLLGWMAQTAAAAAA